MNELVFDGNSGGYGWQLEEIPLPARLDGRQGRNRGQGMVQLSAQDDRAAVLAWLARYADSPATLASYRKEAERLMLWAVWQHGAALSDLTHEDFLLYQRFLADPQPAERWVIAQGQKPARQSPLWRPFAGPLSSASQRQAISILNAMLTWLVAAGYLASNPLALSRKRKRLNPPTVSRFLPQESWQAVKTTIQAMPMETAREKLHAARVRWLFSLLYLGGLRVSEVVHTTMGDLIERRSTDGRTRWWLQVVGKGEKSRLIPVTDEWMEELQRYRLANGLGAMVHADPTPLLLPIIGKGQPIKPMARSAIHEIVKKVVRESAARLRAQGSEFEAVAAHLEQASTHWMRHTAGSHLSEKADIKVVRDNLGHSNISTTSIYLHTEDDQRHDVTAAVHRLGWGNG